MKRYRFDQSGSIDEAEDGHYVRYQEAAAEIAALRKELARYHPFTPSPPDHYDAAPEFNRDR